MVCPLTIQFTVRLRNHKDQGFVVELDEPGVSGQPTTVYASVSLTQAKEEYVKIVNKLQTHTKRHFQILHNVVTPDVTSCTWIPIKDLV